MVSLTRDRIAVLYVGVLVLFGALLVAWAVGLLWWLSSGDGLLGASTLGASTTAVARRPGSRMVAGSYRHLPETGGRRSETVGVYRFITRRSRSASGSSTGSPLISEW